MATFVGGMIRARVSILFLNGWETAPVTLDLCLLFDPRIGPRSILGGVAGTYIGGLPIQPGSELTRGRQLRLFG
jgi:hypothetical protein